MNEEILVRETENVEQTTEESPRMYSQEEVDAIVGRAKARAKAKIEKDYQRRLGSLEEMLKAGAGKESVEEMSHSAPEPEGSEKPGYSARDIEALAKAEAEEIIGSGYEEVVEEVERLAALGADRMTPREKAVFKALAEHRQRAEHGRELGRLGVSEELYNSQQFRDFAAMFKPNTSVQDIYDIYAKTQPKKEIKTMGSMKNSTAADKGVKDFYTRDEALRFTKKDFDNNPALFAAVGKSMLNW